MGFPPAPVRCFTEWMQVDSSNALPVVLVVVGVVFVLWVIIRRG